MLSWRTSAISAFMRGPLRHHLARMLTRGSVLAINFSQHGFHGDAVHSPPIS
jgi:hypothetical protein